MERQKILNLLNEANDSDMKMEHSQYDIMEHNSKANYGVGNEIISNTEVLRSNLCDYNDAFILVRGDITIKGRNLVTEITFKNCAPFTKCITKNR